MLIEDKDINSFNLNSEKSLDQLVPAVLVSGFGNLVFKKSFMRRNGRLAFSYINEYELLFFICFQTEFLFFYLFLHHILFSDGMKIILHPESVNYNKDSETELLTYFREGRTLDHDVVMLNKSSYIPSILAILFFNGRASFKHVSQLFLYLVDLKKTLYNCTL